jgi:segregation and condensation protein A
MLSNGAFTSVIESAPFFEDLLQHAPMVKLPVFEGPLDLLMYLIRRAEIDIYDIPIEKLTEQYLAAIRAMEHLDIEIAGDFFVMAATLMLIKSRMLTAQQIGVPDTAEEENSGPDPRWSLVEQLVEYTKMKEAAGDLSERISLTQDFISRQMPAQPSIPGNQDRVIIPVGKLDLWQVFNKILGDLKQRIALGKISEEGATLAERMEWLLKELADRKIYRFQDVFRETRHFGIWAATFLATLELTRLGETSLLQEETFGDLMIVLREALAEMTRGQEDAELSTESASI